MTLSYRDTRPERFAAGTPTRAFQSIERQAWRRLEILDAATALDDLRALPSNRLEARRGQWSIRINDQRRICFEWPPGDPGPSNVEFPDDH